MKLIVVGLGAIGGVVGAGLHQAGHDVTFIARGRQFETVRKQGLMVDSSYGRGVVQAKVTNQLTAESLLAADAVLVAVKSQDTYAVFSDLTALTTGLRVVCLQNGVANEALFARAYADVYGAYVHCPSSYTEPGIVAAYGMPVTGIIDVGRFPAGGDPFAAALSDSLRAAGFASRALNDVSRWKYGKLVRNLTNALDAACRQDDDAFAELVDRLYDEGAAVLRAASVTYASLWELSARQEEVGFRLTRESDGSSSWQSLVRRSRLETIFLNGEIIALGQRYGVPTPANQVIQSAVLKLERNGGTPRSCTSTQLLSDYRRLASQQMR
jgi:2-dehydropantoate 2-reductase